MGWRAWAPDPATFAVWAWILWFVAWESTAIINDTYLDTWTAHIRPVFNDHPLTWWVGVGSYLWFGVHIFAPAFEQWLKEAIQR